MTWRSRALALAHDVVGDAARILNVLLAVQHLPDGLRLLAHRVPQMHGEDQRVAARVVVEDALGRRVGEDAAVPIELAVDAHGRERRRQRARRHDVAGVELHLAAVEVVHHARAHMRRADRQPRMPAVDRARSRRARPASCAAARSSNSRPGRRRAAHARRERRQVRLEEAGNAAASVVHEDSASATPVQAGNTPHKFGAPRAARTPGAAAGGLRRVAGDEAGVDGADRGADDPVRLDAGLVQRLVDAGLVGAERAAALEHEHDLPVVLGADSLTASRGEVLVLIMVVSQSVVGLSAQCAVQPPSTGIAVPVIEAAASEARNTAKAPSSSTVAKRLFGCCASSTSRITCSRGMPCDLAWPSICASTSGV